MPSSGAARLFCRASASDFTYQISMSKSASRKGLSGVKSKMISCANPALRFPPRRNFLSFFITSVMRQSASNSELHCFERSDHKADLSPLESVFTHFFAPKLFRIRFYAKPRRVPLTYSIASLLFTVVWAQAHLAARDRLRPLTAALAVILALLPGSALGQAPTAKPTTPTASVEHAIELAAKGRCEEALPILKRSAARLADKDLKYRVGMATARCAMSLDQREAAVQALLVLNRDFANDPEVLYITTHYYSQLASRASQQLAVAAPSSYQAHELEAEALESQGRWDEAAAVYDKILEQNPHLPGIHYRLGRVALSKPESAANNDEAKNQFEQELKIDPTNAASEFWLGELARRTGRWNDALPHFSNASKLDPGFAEAFLALGMTYNSAERFSEAVTPLERYVKIVPSDPAGHYQLSIAYARTDRKQDAAREMAIQREISEKSAAAPRAGSATPPQ
jgi:tetratricopeptide (TPR) repeat protein